MALSANEAQFFRFRVFFGACSLQNKVADPQCFAFLTIVYHYFSAWQVWKKLWVGTFLARTSLTLIFSVFYKLHLEVTSFYNTPSGQIISYHVTDVEMFWLFCFISSRHYWSLISPSFRNCKVRNVGARTVGKLNFSWTSPYFGVPYPLIDTNGVAIYTLGSAF